MIVSATQRSASTIFCAELAKKEGLLFGNQVLDGNWRGYSGPKSAWHEYKGEAVEARSFKDVIQFWKNRDQYVILDHSSCPYIMQEASYFVARRDLLSALQSMINIMASRENGDQFFHVTTKIFLDRAFGLFLFCLENEKSIMWMDTKRSFTTISNDQALSNDIHQYVEQHNLREIAKWYNLIY